MLSPFFSPFSPSSHDRSFLFFLAFLLSSLHFSTATYAYDQDIQKGTVFYTKEGNLEVRYENPEAKDQNAQLKAKLFFEFNEDNNRLFNMDICVDLKDIKDEENERKFTKLIVCYNASEPLKWKGKRSNPCGNKDRVNKELCEIVKKCGKERDSRNRMEKHGFAITFNPPIYEFHSLIDHAIYHVNTSFFEKDEIKIIRWNKVPKYCVRLEMGRSPPDPVEVFQTRKELQESIRRILSEAELKNRTDNVTELFKNDKTKITLEADTEDQLEFTLKTDDLQSDRDLGTALIAPDRVSRVLQGVYMNETTGRQAKVYKKKTEVKPTDIMSSTLFYKDFTGIKRNDSVTKVNYQTRPMPKLELDLELHYERAINVVNFTFSGGNIYPCHTEWVELEKFTMERDFYHPEIQKHFAPIHIAYSVGLVNWKNDSEAGFGPGQRKKGRFGPDDKDIEDLKNVIGSSEGFLAMDKRLIEKFGDALELGNTTGRYENVFKKLEEYFTRLDLNNQMPLREITVKQLIFMCGEHAFNLPHVASYVEGEGADVYI